jgi:hypothetical protein
MRETRPPDARQRRAGTIFMIDFRGLKCRAQ